MKSLSEIKNSDFRSSLCSLFSRVYFIDFIVKISVQLNSTKVALGKLRIHKRAKVGFFERLLIITKI